MSTSADTSAPTLHYGRGTVALAAHIALEESGAPYATRVVDMKGEQKGEAFLALNPKARVPVLETGWGVLTETPAMLNYIARTLAPQLLPEAPDALARMEELAAYLASTVHVAHAHKMRGARWTDDRAADAGMRAKVPANMDEAATLIEARYLADGGGPWVLGARYSVADPYLFAVARWMPGDGVDMARHPALSAHMDAMRERPAVARVLALHE